MGLIQSLKELIFGKEITPTERYIKPYKIYENYCFICNKPIGGTDKFICKFCDEAFCYEHRLHSNEHTFEKVEEKPSTSYGHCQKCKKLIKHVYDKTVCPYCMKHLCMSCFPEGIHKCEHSFKSFGITRPKVIDKVLTTKDIEAIRKAKDELKKHASLEREISGLIDYDGKISRTSVGTPESVQPDVYSAVIKEGIFFHTHPNENTLPSKKDYEFASLIESEGSKVKSIVVTQIGFASYDSKHTSTFYGWHEI